METKKTSVSKIAHKKYHRTKKGLITVIYSSQKCNSKRRGHIPPEYTKKELLEWMYSQKTFHDIFQEWVRSGYKKDLKPSIDRIEDNIHYCFNNIQITTWYENNNKENEKRKKGILPKKFRRKKVIQLSKSGDFIAEFESITNAEKSTLVKRQDIGKVCLGKRKTAGGFIWKYKEI